MTRKKIAMIITETTLEFKRRNPFAIINNGLCEDFAMAVIDRAPECEDMSTECYEDLEGQPGHVWIYWNGWHFDCERPMGVRHPRQLPIFQQDVSANRARVNG